MKVSEIKEIHSVLFYFQTLKLFYCLILLSKQNPCIYIKEEDSNWCHFYTACKQPVCIQWTSISVHRVHCRPQQWSKHQFSKQASAEGFNSTELRFVLAEGGFLSFTSWSLWAFGLETIWVSIQSMPVAFCVPANGTGKCWCTLTHWRHHLHLSSKLNPGWPQISTLLAPIGRLISGILPHEQICLIAVCLFSPSKLNLILHFILQIRK